MFNIFHEDPMASEPKGRERGAVHFFKTYNLWPRCCLLGQKCRWWLCSLLQSPTWCPCYANIPQDRVGSTVPTLDFDGSYCSVWSSTLSQVSLAQFLNCSWPPQNQTSHIASPWKNVRVITYKLLHLAISLNQNSEPPGKLATKPRLAKCCHFC